MNIKDTLENHSAVLLFVVLVTGFISGVGTVSYLEAREEKLREKIIEDLRSENKTLSQQGAILSSKNEALSKVNENLNAEYQNALDTAKLASAELQTIKSFTQDVNADVELIGKAISSLLSAYVWIERDESPDRVIPKLDNAIDMLNRSKAVTSITSLTSARVSYQHAPKGEIQRKLDDAISQIEAQISK